MLVAMALILFIMVILSEAFVAGLESFRQLKAIGDMEEKLRTAATALRRDLNADFFEGKRRLSDRNFWNLGTPREGFFRIYQKNPSIYEGQDPDGNASYRATDHYLHFTVKMRGNRPEDFFTANLSAGSRVPSLATTFFDQKADARFQDPSGQKYNSPWAEVAYYLVPVGRSAGSTPLFALYRSQLLVLPDTRAVNSQTPHLPLEPELSCGIVVHKNVFFNPTDLANRGSGPDFTRGLQRNTPVTTPLNGATLLLTDVISFDVQVLRTVFDPVNGPVMDPDFTELLGPTQTSSAEFDTYTPAMDGNHRTYTLNAIQISIRIWDPKTEQARQITVIEDL
jgi:hypothetical protein